jgi:Fur family ferric uptake transcriptional regulator
VNQASIVKAFEAFLLRRGLRLTTQRRRIFERAFATHEHFAAERLCAWLEAEPGARVSRATVYRTLALLVEGGFLSALDPGTGELVYEHVLGHRHHDHLLCLACGRIEEFHDERIEALQIEAARRKGFELVQHSLRLMGYCRACARRRAPGTAASGAPAASAAGAHGAPGAPGVTGAKGARGPA